MIYFSRIKVIVVTVCAMLLFSSCAVEKKDLPDSTDNGDVEISGGGIEENNVSNNFEVDVSEAVNIPALGLHLPENSHQIEPLSIDDFVATNDNQTLSIGALFENHQTWGTPKPDDYPFASIHDIPGSNGTIYTEVWYFYNEIFITTSNYKFDIEGRDIYDSFVSGFAVSTDYYKTPRRITIGDTMQDAIDAYGIEGSIRFDKGFFNPKYRDPGISRGRLTYTLIQENSTVYDIVFWFDESMTILDFTMGFTRDGYY